MAEQPGEMVMRAIAEPECGRGTNCRAAVMQRGAETHTGAKTAALGTEFYWLSRFRPETAALFSS